MKNLLLITACFISSLLYSQRYEVGAIQILDKSKLETGFVSITDSFLVISLDSGKNIQRYEVTAKTKSRVDFKSGSNEYWLSITEDKGRLLGYKYNIIVKCTMEFGKS